MLRPITVITAITLVPHPSTRSERLPHKSTMPAIRGLEETNIRVRKNLPPRLRRDANERVIRGVQHQSGDGDLFEPMRRRGAVIVIVDARESAIVSRHLVIKLPQALEATQPARV